MYFLYTDTHGKSGKPNNAPKKTSPPRAAAAHPRESPLATTIPTSAENSPWRATKRVKKHPHPHPQHKYNKKQQQQRHQQQEDLTLLKEFQRSQRRLSRSVRALFEAGMLHRIAAVTAASHQHHRYSAVHPMHHRHRFEVLEFLGDSVLQLRVTRLLALGRRFMRPHVLTQLRSHCVCNDTLSRVYDALELHTLFPVATGSVDGSGSPSPPPNMKTLRKRKADTVEALVGELSLLSSSSPSTPGYATGDVDIDDHYHTYHHTHLQHVDHCRMTLDELIGYIVYAGEASYFTHIISRKQAMEISDIQQQKQQRLQQQQQQQQQQCEHCGEEQQQQHYTEGVTKARMKTKAVAPVTAPAQHRKGLAAIVTSDAVVIEGEEEEEQQLSLHHSMVHLLVTKSESDKTVIADKLCTMQWHVEKKTMKMMAMKERKKMKEKEEKEVQRGRASRPVVVVAAGEVEEEDVKKNAVNEKKHRRSPSHKAAEMEDKSSKERGDMAGERPAEGKKLITPGDLLAPAVSPEKRDAATDSANDGSDPLLLYLPSDTREQESKPLGSSHSLQDGETQIYLINEEKMGRIHDSSSKLFTPQDFVS